MAEKRDYSKLEVWEAACWGPNGQNQGGMILRWGMPEFGFGELTIYRKDGVLRCDSEYLDRDFVRAVLAKVADTIKIDCEEEEPDAGVPACV